MALAAPLIIAFSAMQQATEPACPSLPQAAYRQVITIDGYLDTASAFVGIVSLVDRDGRARFAVEVVLRGTVGETVVIRDHPALPMNFTVGTRYFIAPVVMPDSTLMTSPCKGSRPIDDINLLAEMVELSAHPVSYSTPAAGPNPAVVVATILGSLVLLGLAVFVRVRQTRGHPD
jgi:hypothetical protein